MSTESNPDDDFAETAEEDLQQRLMRATPEFTTRGFMFAATLKAVEELGGDEAAVRRCLEAAGEKSFMDFYHYPTRSLLLLFLAASEALGPRHGGVEGVVRQISMRCADSYLDTVVGRAALQHTGALPQRFTLALQTLYNAATKYADPEVSFPTSNRSVLSLRSALLPRVYHEGATARMAERMGLVLVRVRARKTGPLSIDLEVSW